MAGTKTKTKKSGKIKRALKSLGAGSAAMELPYMMDLYSDAGLALSGLAEQLGNLGIYKKGGKIKKGPRGCGVAMRGYGKAMKGSKK